MLGLAGNREAAGAVVVRRLGAAAAGSIDPSSERELENEKRRVALKVLALLERDVSADDAIVVVAEFGIRHEQPDVLAPAEVHHLARRR